MAPPFLALDEQTRSEQPGGTGRHNCDFISSLPLPRVTVFCDITGLCLIQ